MKGLATTSRALLGGLGMALAVSACHVATRPSASTRTPAPAPPPYRAVLDQYCVTCHNEQRKTAGLMLDKMDLADVHRGAETWEKVVKKLRAGTMPPAGARRPGKATYQAFASWLEGSLDRAAAVAPNPGRTPALHRLNRAEYSGAIRDLLGIDIDAGALLPPDDSGYGFDNIADVLSVSPMLTERYLSAARKISRLAVGDPALRPATETFAVSKYLRQDDRMGDDLPFGSRAGLAVRYYFPVDGDYFVKIYFLRTYRGPVRGLALPHDVEVRLDGVLVKQVTVGGSVDAEGNPVKGGRTRGREAQAEDVDGMEVRFPAKAGPGLLAVSFVKRASLPEGMLRPAYSITSYEYAGDANVLPGIGSIEIRGPYDVKGPGSSPSRQRLFVCRPTAARHRHGDEERCARQILSTVARRAYRRPVTAVDLEPLLAFYRAGRAESGFDAGIERALRRVLVSPDFLFRMEHEPEGIASGTAYRVGDLELASRLSFFLWSSIPDDELLDLAARGRLHQPAVLEQQVRRMLADRRSRALVTNFAGQWLYLRNLRLVSPDPYVFPDFDDNLRQAFARETELFVESQLREDKSVVELLTADYTFVNERLAHHYGIPNVYGNHFRRVTLDDEARKGLLGKGSVLTVTSYAHRTSPVLRGKWLLENLLGAPPPPPPPNVPPLKEAEAGGKVLPMRERMEAHRANAVCASCHKVMDPLGFALENFDAIGKWRTVSEANTPIDTAGALADGTPVDGPVGLRQALLAHREELVATVAAKLLTYALGRGVESYDAPAVRGIVRGAAADDYRWSSLILGIARSVPFQMRTSEDPAPGRLLTETSP